MTDNSTTYAMKGKLVLSRSGWVLLEVPNAIGNGLFQALSEHGIEQPISETSGRYNAHISVIRPEEVAAVGGPEMIKARGQSIGFNLGSVRVISNPGGWADVSKVWVVEAKSPELMQLRKSLGLGEPKYPFHITFAIRKKNALINKAASIIHCDEPQYDYPTPEPPAFRSATHPTSHAILDCLSGKSGHEKEAAATESPDGVFVVGVSNTGLPVVCGTVSGSDQFSVTEWMERRAADVRRELPDYGQRLKALRVRRGECPGCGTPFKEDEPYPDVEMCEVCERFGKPKLVKEGNALAVQIAKRISAARKQTAEPKSKAQAEAGNYAKGKVIMHNMTIALENPKGSTRSGTDPSGKSWSVTMTADYGYILGTKGLDEDHIDVFIGPDPASEIVFVVDQLKPDTGEFDELKVMLGYTTEDDAREGYLDHYEEGWKGLGKITPLTMKQFHWWMDNCDQTKPVAGAKIKAAADSFYLNAINQTPLQYDQQSGVVQNLLNHLGSIKARGDRAIHEAGSYDRLQNAIDPNRSTRQLSDYMAGRRQPLVHHPLDRLMTEIR